MKIKRTIDGVTEWLASRPIDISADDGVTIDHVETAWTEDESLAFDFTTAVPTAQHARDIAKQLEGFDGVILPPEFDSLPEPPLKKAKPEAPKPALKVERRDTAEGIALRERLAQEKAAREAEERAAREAAEAQVEQ